MAAILWLGVLASAVPPQLASAQSAAADAPVLNYNPQVPIPGGSEEARALQRNQKVSENLLGQYVVTIYRFGVWLAITLAIFMMMVGGFLWVIAGGNPSRVENAKSYLTAAISGLVLALTSFVLLQTVNPDLVIFKPLRVEAPKDLADVGCCCTVIEDDNAFSCTPPRCADATSVAKRTANENILCTKIAESGRTNGFYSGQSCDQPSQLNRLANPDPYGRGVTTLYDYGSCSGNSQAQVRDIRGSQGYCCFSETVGSKLVLGGDYCVSFPVTLRTPQACCGRFASVGRRSEFYYRSCERLDAGTSPPVCNGNYRSLNIGDYYGACENS